MYKYVSFIVLLTKKLFLLLQWSKNNGKLDKEKTFGINTWKFQLIIFEVRNNPILDLLNCFLLWLLASHNNACDTISATLYIISSLVRIIRRLIWFYLKPSISQDFDEGTISPLQTLISLLKWWKIQYVRKISYSIIQKLLARLWNITLIISTNR